MACEGVSARICIVGGGMAGVTCAQSLVHAGFKKVSIFEAQDKLGGRVSTHYDSDSENDPFKIELGANWIHGTKNNPIHHIATENKLLGKLQCKLAPTGRWNWLTLEESGKEVAIELNKFVRSTYHGLNEKAEEFHTNGLPEGYNKKSSFEQFILTESQKMFCESEMKQMFEGYDEDTCDLMMDLIRMNLSFETSISGCHSMSQVSLQQFGSYGYLKGGNPVIGQGYEKVVEFLAKDISTENIHLNSPIQNIQWENTANSAAACYIDRFISRVPCILAHVEKKHSSGSEPISSKDDNCGVDQAEKCRNDIGLDGLTNKSEQLSETKAAQQNKIPHNRTENMNDIVNIVASENIDSSMANSGITVSLTNGGELHFDHVIFTGSLGYLKHFHHTFFIPSLPKDKQMAINKLGIGLVDKIFLEFENLAFLPEQLSGILLCWRNKDKVCDIPNWVRKIVHITVVHKPRQNMLMAWITGLEAEEMERLSETEVGEGCVSALRAFLSNKDIPNPKRVIRTCWGSNPYFEGSYSYVSVGATTDDIETLTYPLCDKQTGKPLVQFAGEATHPKYYSTVHGAYMSGEREAQRLIDYYKLKEQK